MSNATLDPTSYGTDILRHEAITDWLALASTVDGDVLTLKNNAEWSLLKPWDTNDPALAGPWGTFDLNIGWIAGTDNMKQPIMIDKAVTIKGESSETLTVINDTSRDNRLYWITHNSKKVQFENIHWKNAYQPLNPYSAHDVINCKFENVMWPIWTIMDDRIAMPGVVNGDYTIPDSGASLVSGCEFTGCGAGVVHFGSGITMLSNNYHTPGDLPTRHPAYEITNFGDILGPVFGGWPAGTIRQNQMRGCKISNNIANFTGAVLRRSAIEVHPSLGDSDDLEVSGNTIIDFKHLAQTYKAAAIRVIIDEWWPAITLARLEIFGNTFKGNTAPSKKIALIDYPWPGVPVSTDDITVSGNIFGVDGSPIYDAEWADELLPPHPAVYCDTDDYRSVIMSNDYTESGYPEFTSSDNALVFLGAETYGNLVFEKNILFPEVGPAKRWIIDNGENRVKGLPANTAPRPSGVSTAVRDDYKEIT